MVVKSNHEKTLQCSVFGHSVGLLFYTSSSGKGTFCNMVLFQSAISLVISSNTWYLRQGERNQIRILVRV
jgi:guanylate kinase